MNLIKVCGMTDARAVEAALAAGADAIGFVVADTEDLRVHRVGGGRRGVQLQRAEPAAERNEGPRIVRHAAQQKDPVPMQRRAKAIHRNLGHIACDAPARQLGTEAGPRDWSSGGGFGKHGQGLRLVSPLRVHPMA
jgi:hypothetical protein